MDTFIQEYSFGFLIVIGGFLVLLFLDFLGGISSDKK
jgi:hypothetical protein